MQNLNFYLVTDTHFFDPSFKHGGAAYENRSISDQKCVAETPAIMLMYGKEASNRKQEIDRQHYTIPNQRPKDKHFEKI